MRLIDADTIVNYEITGNFECGEFKGLAQCVLLPVEHLRDIPTVYDTNSFDNLKQSIRNETIDDFVKSLYKIGEHKDFDWEDIFKVADQLKVGYAND